MVKRQATWPMLAQLKVTLICLENGGWASFRKKKV
jgi:hypothetical protein